MKYIVNRFVRITVLVLLVGGSARPRSVNRCRPGSSMKRSSSGLTLPTAFTTLPDGRLLVAEKDGHRPRDPATVSCCRRRSSICADSVNDYWDHGLLGIAADPNFATNGFVYLLYTYENDPPDYHRSEDRAADQGDRHRQYRVAGLRLDRPRHLRRRRPATTFPSGTDCIPSDSPSHSVGNIKVAPGRHAVRHHRRRRQLQRRRRRLPCARRTSIRSPARCCTSPPPARVFRATRSGTAISTRTDRRSGPTGSGIRTGSRSIRCRACPYVGDVGWDRGKRSTRPSRRGQRQFRLALLRGPDPSGRVRAQARVSGALRARTECRADARGAVLTTASAVRRHRRARSTTGTSFPPHYHGVVLLRRLRARVPPLFPRQQRRGDGRSGLPDSASGLNGPVYFDTDGQNLLYLSIISRRASADSLHRRESGRQLSERPELDLQCRTAGVP